MIALVSPLSVVLGSGEAIEAMKGFAGLVASSSVVGAICCAESTGGMTGRVAESSSAEDSGEETGAPQLGHAIAVPGGAAIRRPQIAHTISCILQLQRVKTGGTRTTIQRAQR